MRARVTAPLRLRLDTAALQDNWRTLARMSGRAACGAAVKADGYGLGAIEVARRLADAGCRDFFVATWAEAAALAPLGLSVSVLHGVRAEDMALAATGIARPVLNTEAQVARWKAAGGGACDVMVDTGMNRLGVPPAAVSAGLLDGLGIDVLMSHLASADQNSGMNETQRAAFASLAGTTGVKRFSLANSAGIALGRDYALDLTRPGLALYGGVPREEFGDTIRQVVMPEAQVLQRRLVPAGETVGYNATWTARVDTQVAILNIGYADGYRRSFSDRGSVEGMPVIGRVSMDLIAIDISRRPHVVEGDWLALDYSLPSASRQSDTSQYELLTNLGLRFGRRWT